LSIVKFIYDLIDLLLGDDFKVSAFREVLANEPIGIFIQATYPGSVRMCKVKFGIEFVGDSLVISKLNQQKVFN